MLVYNTIIMISVFKGQLRKQNNLSKSQLFK